MITRPIGTPNLPWEVLSSTKVGITIGGGGVNDGKLVGANVITNCAARVGSIVTVYSGVGVAGGETTGNVPAVILT